MTIQLTTLAAVATGGAIGASARYVVSSLVTRAAGVPSFPWGTFAVNIVGALLMGCVIEFAAQRSGLDPRLQSFLTTGILGGFTTFSAFSLELGLMLERGDMGPAFLYATGSVILCVGALFAGMALSRLVMA